MGSLVLPASGRIYIDSQVIIYSVERHPQYSPRLRTLWTKMQRAEVEVVSSELALMETLIVPIRIRNQPLISDFERVLFEPSLQLVSISQPILREAASLRAEHPSLRTPDAIHAASARLAQCTHFLTNDSGLARLPGYNFLFVNDLVDP